MIGIPRPQLPFLYRDRAAGWAMGVCAGISQVTGFRSTLLRISFIVGMVFYPVAAVSAYLLLTVLLRPRPSDADELLAYAPTAEREIERVRLSAAQSEYLQLQERLAALEAETVSREFELRRRFRDAGL